MARTNGSTLVRSTRPSEAYVLLPRIPIVCDLNALAQTAGGDVKGKSKMEPFAYLPLNKKNLNKRYCLCVYAFDLTSHRRKSKAMSQIKKVVRSGNNKGKGQKK